MQETNPPISDFDSPQPEAERVEPSVKRCRLNAPSRFAIAKGRAMFTVCNVRMDILFLSALSFLMANAPGLALPDGAVAELGSSLFWHGDAVAALAFSVDGKLLASAGSSKHKGDPTVVRVWRPATGEQLCQIFTPEGRVSSMSFSPDGRTLVAGCGSRVMLWNAQTGKEIKCYSAHESDVSFVQFSPEGKSIVSADRSGAVHRWECATARRLDQWKPWKGAQPRLSNGLAKEECNAVVVSPDGKTIVWQICSYKVVGDRGLADGDGYFLRVRDLRAGGGAREIEARPSAFGKMAFDSDGRHLASGLGGVWIWDIKGGKPPRVLGKGLANTHALAFSGDGALLASLHADDVVHLWDTKSGRAVDRIVCRSRRDETFASSLALSPDAGMLATGGSEAPFLWDVKARREMHPATGHREAIRQAAFAPDGRTLTTTGFHVQCVWDTKTWKETTRFERGRAAVADETTLAVSGLRFLTQARDGTVRLRETTNGKELRRCEAGRLELREGILAPDGDSAILIEGKRPACAGRIVDLSTGKERACLTFLRLVADPIYSPDGKRLAWVGEDQSAHLVEAATGKERRAFSSAIPNSMQQDGYQRLALSQRGDYLACRSCQKPQAIRVWETYSGVEIGTIVAPDESAGFTAFALSPDGRTVAVGQDDAVRLCETASGQMYRRMPGHRDTVLTLAYSAEGSLLVSGSRDHTALVWDARHPKRETEARYTERELSTLWSALRLDASQGVEAAWKLGNIPSQSVPFLKKRLQPAVVISKAQIQQLLLDLDDDVFKVRERASNRLAQLAERVEADLRKTRKESPSPEVRRRIDFLLADLQRHAVERAAEQLRAVRAVASLEYAATPEARVLLASLSRGGDDVPLTREAKAALRRLDNHP